METVRDPGNDHRPHIGARRAKSVIIHESSYSAARRPAIDSSPSGITDPSYIGSFLRLGASTFSPVHKPGTAPRARTNTTFSAQVHLGIRATCPSSLAAVASILFCLLFLFFFLPELRFPLPSSRHYVIPRLR
ncbi:hypothetical protein PUN28_016041 [Cardiocondyla obscurior]|uniref:Uncharacterized protein n=1 Tax=Cardiocondyla obscurior TaxID=286306 RepID=A0AAW2ET38_9HYME